MMTTTAEGERRKASRRPFRLARRADERVRLMGVDIDMVRPEEVLHQVERYVEGGGKHVIANHNAHSLHLYRRDPEFRAFYEHADLIEADSTPLLLFSRLLGRRGGRIHRCTYLDWRDHFWSLASRNGWRVMYVGGEPGVAERGAASLQARYPGAVLATAHGYFDMAPGSAESLAVVEQVRAFQPHILFVGMGMPRQEQWVARNFAGLPPCVIFSVGAAFDYEAGVQRAAPRWLGRVGLEWLFRLLIDPRRLAYRYLVEPWTLVGAALTEVADTLRRRSPPAFGGRAPAE
jgi:N-acetylglucosaminyldiphosphoundecaprenol N-acetyl-beta-D-mannosaminyltransferase